MSAFIGRQEELDLAHAALHDADGVLVSGAAGIGKSQLLGAIEDQLSHAERRTVRLPTSAATASISLWPFQHLLPQTGTPDLLELARHVHSHLVSLGDDERITLFVDDVHNLDEPSIGMLDHLLGGGHIRLAAAIRTGEPHPPALDELWTRFDVRPVPLGELPLADCTVIVERLLGGPAANDSISHLTGIAQGNPLLLRELVLDAVENGAMQEFDHKWRLVRLEAAATQAIGDRTRLHVQRRMARLGPDEQDLLRLLAVAGDIAPETVPAHLTEALQSLEARRLARVGADRPGQWSVRLDHPLLAEVVLRDMLGSNRRDALRRLVAYTRQAKVDVAGSATRLALWAEASGDHLTGPEWLRATNEAVAAFDHEAAARWAERAVAADPASHPAHLALGRILRHQGNLTDAARAYDQAEQCAETNEEIATAAVERSALVALPLGRPRDAIDGLRAAEERLAGTDHAWSLRSEAALLGSLLGTFDDVLFKSPNGSDSDRASDSVRWQLGLNELYSRTMVGRVASIDDLTAQTIHFFPSVAGQRPQELDYVLGLRGAARLVRGEAPQGLDELASIVEARRNQGAYRGISAIILAHLQGIACDPRAVATSIDGVEQHEWIDPLGSAPIALAIASLVAGATGDLAAAEVLAARGEAGSEPWRSIWVGRARAQVHHLRGDDAAARELCTTAAQTAIDTSHFAYASVTAHDLVRYGDPSGAAGLLDQSVAATEGCHYLQLLQRHAHAVAQADRAELRAAVDEFAAMGAPWLSALCYHQLARLADDEGEVVEARRAVTSGDLAFAHLHPFVAPTPPAVTDPLSSRESEVAALAGEGLSSGAIAEQLELSVRTVDNHLHRVYRKLEIDGRDQLTQVLAIDGPGNGAGQDPGS